MSDFILKKQRRKESRAKFLTSALAKQQLGLIKLVLFVMTFGIFIYMSAQNSNLFLSELLISGGIIMMLLIIHFLSNNDK
ncbi:hypothetical protein [uncultured Psychroserpens sp.]|uniref:hypothetical protein n=1 Tax=uncultured Psychroserpens sp. TaxID=255436 RepID=UPI0026331E32|nr:hypothetical protein [uncultured Psychroserpens sp.]